MEFLKETSKNSYILYVPQGSCFKCNPSHFHVKCVQYKLYAVAHIIYTLKPVRSTREIPTGNISSTATKSRILYDLSTSLRVPLAISAVCALTNICTLKAPFSFYIKVAQIFITFKFGFYRIGTLKDMEFEIKNIITKYVISYTHNIQYFNVKKKNIIKLFLYDAIFILRNLKYNKRI